MEHAVREPGDTIAGYRVVETLGSGGSGKVYKVEDDNGNEGALKLIDDPDDEQAVSRLRREVDSLMKLSHHAVPAVLDAEFEGDEKFIVYQFVEGRTLTDWVAEHGPLLEEDLGDFAETLVSALRAVHKTGVVHRDVTPANVMMGDQGPMLIDFGLSQLVHDDRLTRTGLVSGTVGYVAPEVIDGHEPDEGADFWSWAAVVAFAATGSSAFGHGKGALRRTLEGKAELPSIEGSDELAAALSPVRESRPDPNVVIAALRGEGEGLPVFEMYAPEGEAERAERRQRTHQIDPADEADLASGIIPPIREPRASVIGTWAVALALMAALAPTLAMLTAVALATAGRAEHRRVASLAAARAKRGPRRGDAVLATAGLPWHFLRSLVELLPSVTLALIASSVWGAFAWWMVSSGTIDVGDSSAAQVWGHGVALATAAGLGLVLLWWGPWSDETRDGAHRATYLISSTESARRGWIALGVIAIGSMAVALGLEVEPSWWPLPPLPGLT